jgi:hypothetical protein
MGTVIFFIQDRSINHASTSKATETANSFGNFQHYVRVLKPEVQFCSRKRNQSKGPAETKAKQKNSKHHDPQTGTREKESKIFQKRKRRSQDIPQVPKE